MTHVTLIPGDGIGPDIVAAGLLGGPGRAMMLDHLGHVDAAGRVQDAVRDVLREGKAVTRDLRPEDGVGTRAMTEALVAHVARV